MTGGSGCGFCFGMEDVLVESARRYKVSGWDPDGEGGSYRFGYTTECEYCGRCFDFDAADEAYERTDGPASPTGSPADEIRRLAAELGLNPAGFEEFVDVYRHRPMGG